MSQLKFTKDHEWIAVEGNTGVVGITDYAKDALGDLVFLDLPEKGRTLSKGDDFAVVESVKAASEIYTPVSGEVSDVHDALADNLDDLGGNREKGWIVKITLSDPSELDGLMDEAAYQDYLESVA
ncbi:MAG: glycine cleavage system protein GcvH [Pseudobdellovibrionaceae bacterium]